MAFLTMEVLTRQRRARPMVRDRAAVVKVGRMHGVACGAQLTGETADGTGEAERVVEDDDVDHR
jgi:hypothetical protein